MCILHALTTLYTVGFGGFQANIIQFGAHQLIDVSTTKIKFLIAWYDCSAMSSKFISYLCLLLCSRLIVYTSLTMIVSSNNFLNMYHLIKEPATFYTNLQSRSISETSNQAREVPSYSVKMILYQGLTFKKQIYTEYHSQLNRLKTSKPLITLA